MDYGDNRNAHEGVLKAQFAKEQFAKDLYMAGEGKLGPSLKFGSAASEELNVAYHLIPPDSLRRVARIFAEGMEAYPGKAINFSNICPAIENYPWQQERFSHAMDHLLKFSEGDTSEDHLAKVAGFCLVMMEIQRQEKKGDPRK